LQAGQRQQKARGLEAIETLIPPDMAEAQISPALCIPAVYRSYDQRAVCLGKRLLAFLPVYRVHWQDKGEVESTARSKLSSFCRVDESSRGRREAVIVKKRRAEVVYLYRGLGMWTW
jgi:hypothetical protein